MQADTSCAVRFSGHRDEDEPGDHSFVSMSVMTSVKQYDTPNNVSIKHFMIHVRRPCFCTCIAKIRALAVHAQETALKRPVASTDPSTLFPLSLPCHQAVSPTTSPPCSYMPFYKRSPPNNIHNLIHVPYNRSTWGNGRDNAWRASEGRHDGQNWTHFDSG